MRPRIKYDVDNMWNFLYVKKHIQNFNPPKNGEHAQQIEFLARLEKYTDEATSAISDLLRTNTYFTTPMSQNVNDYADKIIAAHAKAWAAADHLNLLLADEFKRYYREDENNPDRQCPAYLELLDKLTTCCLGVINNEFTRELYKVKNKIKPVPDKLTGKVEDPDKSFVLKYVSNYLIHHGIQYDLALAAGGRFYPIVQALDPLVGTRAIDQDKYAEDLGHCQGRVVSWAMRVTLTGEPELLNLLDDKIHDFQKREHPVNPVVKFNEIGSNEAVAHFILNQLNAAYIYMLTFGFRNTDTGKMAGHAMGIRRVPGRKMIEFVDPNIGYFTFSDESKFIDFFLLLHSTYCLYEKIIYSEMSMTEVTKQLQLYNGDQYTRIDSTDNYLAKHTTKNGYKIFFKKLGKFNSDIIPEDLKAYDFKQSFIENCLVRIKYTNDVDVLLWLKDVLSKDPDRVKGKDNTFPIVEAIKNVNDKAPKFQLFNKLFKKQNAGVDSYTRLTDAIDSKLAELEKSAAPEKITNANRGQE